MIPIQRTATQIVPEDRLPEIKKYWENHGYTLDGVLPANERGEVCATFIKTDRVFQECFDDSDLTWEAYD